MVKPTQEKRCKDCGELIWEMGHICPWPEVMDLKPAPKGTLRTRALIVDGQSGDVVLEEQLAGVMTEAFELWKQRHRKYGPKNIGLFGAAGCVVRSGDKLARLGEVYLKDHGREATDESVQDSWLDLLNYAAMGLMCERGQWPTT